MTAEEYGIDFSKAEIHECGATLVTLLAIPRDDAEDSTRAALHASLCSLVLRAKFEESEEIPPRLMKPIHAFRELKVIGRNLRTLKRRLRDRMVAARMVIPFLQEVDSGQPPRLPKGVKRFSLHEMSGLVLADAGQSETKNVETRIWRPSLPVIHLAAATQILLDIGARNGRPLHIGDLLTSRRVIEAIIQEARRYETLIERITRVRIDAGTLIRVRLQN
jgi:hypothetical protein